MFEASIILSIACDEPQGSIVRHVRPMLFTMENLRQFWDKSRQFSTLFTSEIRGDFKKFIELFVYEDVRGLNGKGLVWVIDDFVGVFYMTDIDAGANALVHYSFFDRRQHGRVEITKAMLRYVFEKYQFRRLSVEIPFYATKAAFNFTERLGFVKEGRKRKAAFYKGDYFDVNCYGILREEVT